MREREGERGSERGRGTVGQTDKQIDVQMTYVMQYFLIIIRYISDIMNIHRPIFFITVQ